MQGRGNSDDRPRRSPYRSVRGQGEPRPDRSARYASGRRTTSEPGASGTARTRGAPRGTGARPAGRSDATGTGTVRPTRTRPPVATHDPKPRRTVKQRLQLVLVVASVLVMVLTGTAWGLYRDITAGITTTNVIAGGDDDGADNILLVGVDSRTDAQGNPLPPAVQRLLSSGPDSGVLNSDTIILLHVPKGGGAAVAFSIPRDSYVNIPGYQRDKINAAYPATKALAAEQLVAEGVKDPQQVETESSQKGRSTLIQTVEDLTGLHVDHYAEINLLGFYNLTEAIGGVDVCLKASVNDPLSGARFRAGPQTISGASALAFVRQRHGLPNGDLDRIIRQQVFMTGMAKKVFSGDVLTPGSETLDKLRAAIQKSVVLDEDWNVIEFAQQMMNFTGGNVSFQTIPVGRPDLETPEDGSAIEVDPDEVRTFVDGIIGKKPPPDKGKPEADGGQDSVADTQVTVNVRNASGTGGMAQSVADSLSGQGFNTGEIGNADLRDDTVVRYADGEQDAGNQVAEALGGNPVVEPDTNLPGGTVTVLIGSDYQGPNGTEASGDGLAHEPLLRLSPGKAAQPAKPDKSGCVN